MDETDSGMMSVDDLANAPDELIALLAQAGLISKQNLMELHQMKQADALRNTPAPEGIKAGGMYVAANPLSYIATGIDRVRGELEGRQREGNYMGNLDKYGAAAAAMARHLRDMKKVKDPNAYDPTAGFKPPMLPEEGP